MRKIGKNKAHLVQMIHARTRMDKEAVEKFLDAFIHSVKNLLQSGESVNLRSFGTFSLKKRSSKKGRNFHNNMPVIIPEHWVPYFKPSRSFASRIKKKNMIKKN